MKCTTWTHQKCPAFAQFELPSTTQATRIHLTLSALAQVPVIDWQMCFFPKARFQTDFTSQQQL